MTIKEIDARLEELEPQIDAAADAGDVDAFTKLTEEHTELINRLLYGGFEQEG